MPARYRRVSRARSMQGCERSCNSRAPRPRSDRVPASYNSGDVTQYIRYQTGSAVAHGILDGETVRELNGDIFENPTETGATHRLADVTLLAPCQPGKIMAVGLNYGSHIGNRPRPAH